MTNFTMAAGTRLTNQAAGQITGVMGIAYNNDESNQFQHYPNFPDMLVRQGIIKSTAYSLWLDDMGTFFFFFFFCGIHLFCIIFCCVVLCLGSRRGLSMVRLNQLT